MSITIDVDAIDVLDQLTDSELIEEVNARNIRGETDIDIDSYGIHNELMSCHTGDDLKQVLWQLVEDNHGKQEYSMTQLRDKLNRLIPS